MARRNYYMSIVRAKEREEAKKKKAIIEMPVPKEEVQVIPEETEEEIEEENELDKKLEEEVIGTLPKEEIPDIKENLEKEVKKSDKEVKKASGKRSVSKRKVIKKEEDDG